MPSRQINDFFFTKRKHVIVELVARHWEPQLENLNEPNVFMTPLQRVEDKTKASAAWAKITASAKSLAIHPNEMLAVSSVLAAIYHLGVASVTRNNMGKTQFARPQVEKKCTIIYFP